MASDTSNVLKDTTPGPMTREQYYRYRNMKPPTKSRRNFKKIDQNNVDPRGEAAKQKTFKT